MNNYLLWLFFLSFFLGAVRSNAQLVVDLQDVDVIIYNDNAHIELYQKTGENQFIEVYFYLDGKRYNDPQFNYNFADISYNNKVETLSQIYDSKYQKIIFTKDLENINIKEGLKLQVKETWASEENNQFVLKFLSSNLSVMQELFFAKRSNNRGGFGSSVKYKDDNLEKWRIHHARYNTIVDLNFGNNKHLFLLNDGDDIDFLFFKLKGVHHLVSDYDGETELFETSKFKTSYFTNFNRWEYEYFYTVQKRNNKYRLYDSFNEDILKTAYDTIMHNKYFIIAKKDDDYTIFKSNLKKVKIANIKSAYLYRNGLEILTNKGANYYDSDLNIIEKFPQISYVLCGTVESTIYYLKYEELLKNHYIEVIDGGFGAEVDTRNFYYLNDINKRKKENVTFLDDTKVSSWDGNSDYVGEVYGYPKYLKIKRRKKYGIKEYYYSTFNDSFFSPDTITDRWGRKQINYFPNYIEGEDVLPIKYDSIVQRKDGLTYFYRRKKLVYFQGIKKFSIKD